MRVTRFNPLSEFLVTIQYSVVRFYEFLSGVIALYTNVLLKTNLA